MASGSPSGTGHDPGGCLPAFPQARPAGTQGSRARGVPNNQGAKPSAGSAARLPVGGARAETGGPGKWPLPDWAKELQGRPPPLP